MMVNKMRASDQISVVAYDDRANVIVPSTRCVNKQDIIQAIQNVTKEL